MRQQAINCAIKIAAIGCDLMRDKAHNSVGDFKAGLQHFGRLHPRGQNAQAQGFVKTVHFNAKATGKP